MWHSHYVGFQVIAAVSLTKKNRKSSGNTTIFRLLSVRDEAPIVHHRRHKDTAFRRRMVAGARGKKLGMPP